MATRTAANRRAATGGPATADIALDGPLDLAATLEPLGRYDDLLDRWDGRVLRRTVRRPGHAAVAYAVTPLGDVAHPGVRVDVERAGHLEVAAHAARETVLTAVAPLRALADADPVIRALAGRHPGVGMVRHADLFLGLLRAISAQQVNLRWAATTRARIATTFGERHEVGDGEVWSLDPVRLARVAPAELRALQLTTRKAEYIVGVAGAVAAGGLDVDELRGLPDAEVVERLVAVRGIGRWSAEWVLARTLGRPVVVAGDLGVRKVVAQAYLGVPIADEATVRRLTLHWGAAASAAQWLLLHASAAGDDLMALGARHRGR